MMLFQFDGTVNDMFCKIKVEWGNHIQVFSSSSFITALHKFEMFNFVGYFRMNRICISTEVVYMSKTFNKLAFLLVL